MDATGNNRGFTVFEVLISVILLAIGMVALASLQVIGIRGNVNAEDRSMAATLLRSKLSEFSSLEYRVNPMTGEAHIAAELSDTGGFKTYDSDERVNQNGLTPTALQAKFDLDSLDKEEFRYEIVWKIEDVIDHTQAGAWKRVTVIVKWKNRSTQDLDPVSMEIGSVPLVASYM